MGVDPLGASLIARTNACALQFASPIHSRVNE
jgi:hypothetical protein